MKGAVLDYITSLLDRIPFTTKAAYQTRYEIEDLGDDDFVTKYLLQNSVPPAPPDPTAITAGVTATPLTVPYSTTSYPGYLLMRTDGSYDNNTPVVFTGGNFTITGDADSGGKFADNYTFIIKP